MEAKEFCIRDERSWKKVVLQGGGGSDRARMQDVLYDHCLFTYKVDGQLAGILLLFVGDIFYAHTSKFIKEVMNKVAKEFMVGRTEEKVFT